MTSSPPLLDPRPDLVDEAESDLLDWEDRERLTLRLFDLSLKALVKRLDTDPESINGNLMSEVVRLLGHWERSLAGKRPPDMGDFLANLPFPEATNDGTTTTPAPPDTTEMNLPFPTTTDPTEAAHLEDLQRKVEMHERVARREDTRYVGEVKDTSRW